MNAGSAVTLKRGALYLGCDVCDRYFAGLEAVILLRRGQALLRLLIRRFS